LVPENDGGAVATGTMKAFLCAVAAPTVVELREAIKNALYGFRLHGCSNYFNAGGSDAD
jgi:hypothetical protein